MAKKRIHVFYSGKVQGVGFRFTAESFALELGLVGWVRNLNDGRVELEVEGEEGKLRNFLDKLKNYFDKYIKNVELKWLDSIDEYRDFEIRFY
ncbi:MAG: acylphosphatase [Candidatus Omnitrophica bacterium]|nr:acylphosphatase [Candidatus Omnitrophota bacterium]